jgi:uncharacterized protein with HEPN domain
LKDPFIYIEHINDALIKIKAYTKGFNLESFLKSSLVQDAVIRKLEIIGEATSSLDNKFRDNYNHIEWKKMAGLRDKLIHDYIGVDLGAIWGLIEKVLPGLQKQIAEILKSVKKL